MTRTARTGGAGEPATGESATGESATGESATGAPATGAPAGVPTTDQLVEDLSGPGRLEAFSDGIMAIAITLLILDVRLPSGRHDQSLLAQLGRLWPSYLA
jgi:hypothetical protein